MCKIMFAKPHEKDDRREGSQVKGMSPDRATRSSRVCFAGAAALVLVAVAAATGITTPSASASSHREAPLISNDPRHDNTDVYAFVSPDDQDTVTLVANWLPFQEPNGGPNFYQFQAGSFYDINIDGNGDAKADITYRWVFKDIDLRDGRTFIYNNGVIDSFDDPTLLFKQTYTLSEIRDGQTTVLAQDAKVAPSNVGAASVPDYGKLRQEAITHVAGGGQSYAGQADDSFFLDLRIFDLLYGGNLSETGNDTLAGYNVQTLALQVPKTALALKGDPARNPVIGVWSTTSKPGLNISGIGPASGPVQVSRLGNPLINEVVSSANLKDPFNASQPDQDATNQALVDRVLVPELPQLVDAIYHIPPPPTPRNDLVEIFLTGIAKNAPTLDGTTAPIQADLNSPVLNKDVDPKLFVPSEQLRLNMSIPVTESPSRLGVLANDLQGFPNGRRLTDDVVDIELQALEGAASTGQIVAALAAGDSVNVNDVAFSKHFPYVGLPNTLAVNQSGSQMPNGGVETGAGGTADGKGWISLGAGLGAIVLLGAGLVLGRRFGRPGVVN
jgi:hypothetical protein